MIVYTNEFLEISEENGKVYITTLKSGFPLKDFDGILRCFPRIKLTNFALLKDVLLKVTDQPVEIGQWLPNIDIEISKDKMTVSLYVHETLEILRKDHGDLLAQIKQLLSEHNVVQGVKEVDFNKIIPGKAYVIAEGTPAIKGDDAKVTYLEIPERKPVIREDGKADYFDMNFIFEIKENDWLGEKIPAQPGIDGINVHGDILPAQMGKDVPLKYDKKSAYEIEEDGKIVVRSQNSGVVEQRQGLISVNRHLPIDGDIGVETGNIQFDGSISIRGTVHNGFSVIAKGDISIEALEGVTGAKLIKSIEGDIFIKGGIFGMGETQVDAGGSIFVKHVNDANLVAGKDIVIGSYTLGSNLHADSILVDERKGKIIGGRATAKNTIVTAISGNRLERRTELIIESINKQEGYEILQEKAALLKATQEETIQLTAQINQLVQIKDRLNENQKETLNKLKELLEVKKENALQIDNEIKKLMTDLRSSGKEEIVVVKEAYPGTYIQIGKKSSLLSKMTNGKFLLEFGELNV